MFDLIDGPYLDEYRIDSVVVKSVIRVHGYFSCVRVNSQDSVCVR